MKRTRAVLLTVAFGLLALTPLAAAAPDAGPCVAGAAYDPACDVDRDGDVDIFDIQKTAGHWNQTGTWAGDNNHNHLGQTWTGANNPLTLTGAYGAPLFSPLILSNSAGVGMRVTTANSSGVYIDNAGGHGVVISSASLNGVYVGHASQDGLFVCRTGSASSCTNDETTNNGVEIANAQHHGLLVNSTGQDGIYVWAAGGWSGAFWDSIFVAGTCTGCLQANFAVNAGDRALQPGDVVSIQTVIPTDFDIGSFLWQVVPAQSGQTVVGVVKGRAEVDVKEEIRPGQTGVSLVPREGAAEPGEYVSIVYSGPMQVRVAPAESAVAAGTRLTAAADGTVRPLGTVKVQLAGGEGTADMLESAPLIGVALEPAVDGMVWVLVNPQ